MSQPSIHPAIALIQQRFSANHFDPTHALGEGDIPALLVAVGQAAPGNWPQKPRRPVAQVLEIL